MIFIKRLNTYGISNWIIFLLFLLSIFSVFAQMVGLGIFLPIFEYIFQNGISNNQNLILRYVNFLISLMNIETTLGSLLIVAFLFYIISQVFLYIIAYAILIF